MATSPFTTGALERAARAFAAGALEGFDPRLSKGIEVPEPAGRDSEDRCAQAMPSVGEIDRNRRLTAFGQCVDLAIASSRLRHARAA